MCTLSKPRYGGSYSPRTPRWATGRPPCWWADRSVVCPRAPLGEAPDSSIGYSHHHGWTAACVRGRFLTHRAEDGIRMPLAPAGGDRIGRAARAVAASMRQDPAGTDWKRNISCRRSMEIGRVDWSESPTGSRRCRCAANRCICRCSRFPGSDSRSNPGAACSANRFRCFHWRYRASESGTSTQSAVRSIWEASAAA